MKKAITAIACGVLLVAVSLTEACRTSGNTGGQKPAAGVAAGRGLYEAMLGEMPRYDKVSVKCRLSLGSLSSRAQIRMIKERFVQISLQPVLGVEVFRIMLTPDSLYVLDRINGIAAAESVSAITGSLPEGVGMPQLQSLLLGEPFLLSGNITEGDYGKFRWSMAGGKPVLQTATGGGPGLEFTVGKEGAVEQTRFSDGNGNTLACTYSSRISAKPGGSVPGEVSIAVSVPARFFAIEAGMKDMSYDWDKTFRPDTGIPGRYTRISFGDIVNTYLK